MKILIFIYLLLFGFLGFGASTLYNVTYNIQLVDTDYPVYVGTDFHNGQLTMEQINLGTTTFHGQELSWPANTFIPFTSPYPYAYPEANFPDLVIWIGARYSDPLPTWNLGTYSYIDPQGSPYLYLTTFVGNVCIEFSNVEGVPGISYDMMSLVAAYCPQQYHFEWTGWQQITGLCGGYANNPMISPRDLQHEASITAQETDNGDGNYTIDVFVRTSYP